MRLIEFVFFGGEKGQQGQDFPSKASSKAARQQLAAGHLWEKSVEKSIEKGERLM